MLNGAQASPAGFDASDRAIRRAVGFAPELSSADAGWNGVAALRWTRRPRSCPGAALAARRGALGARVLARALERIEASIEQGVSLQALAQDCGLSRAYFAAAFRAATGQSAHRYLTQRRLLRARAPLREAELSLSQIALRCGFSSQAHFSDAFRRAMGATPSAFRQRLS